jgi:BirA family biotin operon repressor/biotin-[acetyl-CoA-carboxylase] ligase
MGKKLISVPECPSTNDLASQIAIQPSTIEGTVVITEHQTAGKGQRGNVWVTEKGQNLTFSTILKPKFLKTQEQFQLTMCIALGITDFLSTIMEATISIKWPNDILVNGKKVCGILIENQINSNMISHSIIGVGLNVNQKTFSFPNASSLSAIAEKTFSLPELFEQLLGKIESRYLQLKSGTIEVMKEEYLNLLLWLNEEHLFSASNTEFSGIIKGVDQTGRLDIETSEGNRFFSAKEVVYIS